jgi:proline iminopeptidase
VIIAALVLAATIPSADGIQLWYTEVGKGSPIVVIHGGPGMDHSTLEADLVPLTKRHRLIYYDQRGGGRSSLPEDPALLSIDRHVEDLEALRKHLGLEKMTILGHSFGPAIAALYAIRHPERVEKMIFIGPVPPRKGKFFEEFGANLMERLGPENRKRADEARKAIDTATDVTKACRDYWAILMPPRVAKSLPATVVKSDLCASPPEAIRFGLTKTLPATFGSLGDWNWTADLAKVKAPVLIIHGEEDAIPMHMVAEWATALPNARLVRVPESAHFPHAERPKRVFREIERFLSRR